MERQMNNNEKGLQWTACVDGNQKSLRPYNLENLTTCKQMSMVDNVTLTHFCQTSYLQA